MYPISRMICLAVTIALTALFSFVFVSLVWCRYNVLSGRIVTVAFHVHVLDSVSYYVTQMRLQYFHFNAYARANLSALLLYPMITKSRSLNQSGHFSTIEERPKYRTRYKLTIDLYNTVQHSRINPPQVVVSSRLPPSRWALRSSLWG